jgi:hypothetical protein
LERKIDATKAKLMASTEQNMVFAHMIERLKMELLALQKKDNETKGRQNVLGHDMQSVVIQRQQAEMELKVEEEVSSSVADTLHVLDRSVGARVKLSFLFINSWSLCPSPLQNLDDLMYKLSLKRESHEGRIAGIKKIISDRQLLQERQLARNKKKEEIMTKADMGVDEEQKLKRMNVIRQLYTTILEKKMSDDEEQLAR